MWAWLGRLVTGWFGPPAASARGVGPDALPGGRAGEAVGLEVAGPEFHPLIPEGAALPASCVQMFTTSAENQAQIDIPVLARRRREAWRALGPFVIREVSPAAAGCAQVTVTFCVRADGSVEVTATDLANGRVSSQVVGRVGVDDQ